MYKNTFGEISMLEKINPQLVTLENLYEKYRDKKRIFLKTNKTKLGELENPLILQAIRETIARYEGSNFFVKFWISLKSLFLSVGYYKNLIQYHDLNDFIQKMRLDLLERPEKIDSFDGMIALLNKFDAEESVKNTISNIYQELLEVRSNFSKNAVSEILPVVPSVKSRSVSPSSDVQAMIDEQSKVVRILEEKYKMHGERLTAQDEELADFKEEIDAKMEYFMGQFRQKLINNCRNISLDTKQKRKGFEGRGDASKLDTSSTSRFFQIAGVNDLPPPHERAAFTYVEAVEK
jgi:hypothetical protein